MFWPEEAFASEEAYRLRMLGLVGQAQHLARRDSWDDVHGLHALFLQSQPRCLLDPLASAYDLGLGFFGVLYAEAAANTRRWLDAYRLVARVQELIKAGEARRAAAGIAPRPNSELRWVCLRILADCKWQDEEENRNRLMQPADILAEFHVIERGVHTKLEQHYRPCNQRRFENVRLSLAWTGLAVAKMTARYLPRRLPETVLRFNRCYGPTLALEVGHYRGSPPLPARRQFYWDFELAKLHLAGRLTEASLEECYRQLCLNMELCDVSRMMMRATEAFYQEALQRLRQGRIEVLSA